MDEVVNGSISVQKALDQVEMHKNLSLESVLLRQIKAITISPEEVARTVYEYK